MHKTDSRVTEKSSFKSFQARSSYKRARQRGRQSKERTGWEFFKLINQPMNGFKIILLVD